MGALDQPFATLCVIGDGGCDVRKVQLLATFGDMVDINPRHRCNVGIPFPCVRVGMARVAGTLCNCRCLWICEYNRVTFGRICPLDGDELDHRKERDQPHQHPFDREHVFPFQFD